MQREEVWHLFFVGESKFRSVMAMMKRTTDQRSTASKKVSSKPTKRTVAKKRRTLVPTPAQARGLIEKGAKTVSEVDIEHVYTESKKISELFSKGKLKELIDDGTLLLDVVSDYWTGKYRAIPYFSLAAIVFSLLYVLSPIDLIPDAIPVIGLVDDALVIKICLLLVLQDLRAYEAWKLAKSKRKKK
jgi:uncharacterized membrane protein YkvA (DUF1232 family)